MARVAGCRAEHDDDVVRIVATPRVDEVERATGELCPLIANALDDGLGGRHGIAQRLVQLEVAVLVGEHARGDGVLGVEQREQRRALAQELLGRLVVHELGTLHGMRGDEAVERGHDGQLHVFILGGANRDHRVVIGLLGVFGKEE